MTIRNEKAINNIITKNQIIMNYAMRYSIMKGQTKEQTAEIKFIRL